MFLLLLCSDFNCKGSIFKGTRWLVACLLSRTCFFYAC